MSFPESPYDEEDIITIEPTYKGYQLIGDSQFLRFSEKILNSYRKKWRGLAYLGLCVSGQKTENLLKRLQNRFHPSSEKMILMIGTNDLLQNTKSHKLHSHFEGVFHELVYKSISTVEKLIILTIPPVPRLEKSPEHWKVLKAYNNFIRTYHNGKNVIVVDAYPKFIKNNASSSSLVSHSSDVSPLQNSNNIIKFRCLTSNFGKIRTNLRIEVDFNERSERNIYLTGSDSDSSSDSEDLGHPTRITTPSKRTYSSSRSSAPNPKRTSSRIESHNISQDDHNDIFYINDNPESGEQFEKINREYFEKYFDKECTRQDLIHLNFEGLQLLDELILDAINSYS